MFFCISDLHVHTLNISATLPIFWSNKSINKSSSVVEGSFNPLWFGKENPRNTKLELVQRGRVAMPSTPLLFTFPVHAVGFRLILNAMVLTKEQCAQAWLWGGWSGQSDLSPAKSLCLHAGSSGLGIGYCMLAFWSAMIGLIIEMFTRASLSNFPFIWQVLAIRKNLEGLYQLITKHGTARDVAWRMDGWLLMDGWWPVGFWLVNSCWRFHWQLFRVVAYIGWLFQLCMTQVPGQIFVSGRLVDRCRALNFKGRLWSIYIYICI